jgi:hypothetical protein
MIYSSVKIDTVCAIYASQVITNPFLSNFEPASQSPVQRYYTIVREHDAPAQSSEEERSNYS